MQSRSPCNTSDFVHSSVILEDVESSVLEVSLFVSQKSCPHSCALWKGLFISIQPASLSHAFPHVHEREMLKIERKITNFTTHSMQNYTSTVNQFLLIFCSCWRPGWQMHKVNTYLLFQNTDVWGSGENDFIHALDTRDSAVVHSHRRWAHIPQLSSTSRFTLISAEVLCQNE